MKNKTKTNLLVDILLIVVFLIVYEEKATGTTIHEWLGIAIGFIFIIHIILHWNWLVASTKHLFNRMKTESRLNYILDILIYIGFTTIMFSGIMISESFLPTFGIKVAPSHYWKEIHFVSVDVTLFLTAFHFALHWKWIVNNCKRYIINPLKGKITNETTEPILRSSKKSQPANFLSVAKVGYQFFIILVFSGLISLGWYAASGTISAEPNSREYRQREEQNMESKFNMDDERSSERFGRDHKGHQNGNGHHDEKGSFRIEILKNLLIFSIVTFVITSVSNKIKVKNKPIN